MTPESGTAAVPVGSTGSGGTGAHAASESGSRAARTPLRLLQRAFGSASPLRPVRTACTPLAGLRGALPRLPALAAVPHDCGPVGGTLVLARGTQRPSAGRPGPSKAGAPKPGTSRPGTTKSRVPKGTSPVAAPKRPLRPVRPKRGSAGSGRGTPQFFARARRAWDRPLTAYYLILGGSLLLTVLGLVMVFSASQIEALQSGLSSTYFFRKQLVAALVGK